MGSRFSKSLWAVALLSAALALLLGSRASALASGIVYDDGGYVHFMNDDGSSGGTMSEAEPKGERK